PAGLRRLGERLLSSERRGLVRAVHDVSHGGLSVTLAEMAFGGGLGFAVDLDATGLRTASLALVVEGPEGERRRFERTFAPPTCSRLGEVVATDATLRWAGRELATVPLLPLYELWRPGLGLPYR